MGVTQIGAGMPVKEVGWDRLAETITNLEKGRNEIVQVLESPRGVMVVYRKREWETR